MGIGRGTGPCVTASATRGAPRCSPGSPSSTRSPMPPRQAPPSTGARRPCAGASRPARRRRATRQRRPPATVPMAAGLAQRRVDRAGVAQPARRRVVLAEIVDLDELSSQRSAVRSMAQLCRPDQCRTIPIEQRRPTRSGATRRGPVRDAGCAATSSPRRTGSATRPTKPHARAQLRNIVLATSVGLAVVAITSDSSAWSVRRSCRSASTGHRRRAGGRPAAAGTDGRRCPARSSPSASPPAPRRGTVVRGIRGTSTPYGVPVAIAWLKLPASALDALFGMLMVHGGFIRACGVGHQGQIIAYAICAGTPSRCSPG